MSDTECASKVTLTDVLTFITGADRIPPLGFEAPIKIDFYTMTSVQHFPTVSTCDLRLWLPRGVSDPEYFQNLMEEAVLGSHGFGKC